MAKLIYIQGAQGVGKSTLLNDFVSSTEFQIKCFNEIARTLIKKGVSHGLEAKKEDYFAYVYRHIANHNYYIKNRFIFDLFISDRSIIDVLVYAQICFNDNDTNYVAELCTEYFQMISSDVDLVIYLPIEFEIVDDGVRNFSKDRQKEYDRILKETLVYLGIDFVEISGSRSDRLKKMTELVMTIYNK